MFIKKFKIFRKNNFEKIKNNFEKIKKILKKIKK